MTKGPVAKAPTTKKRACTPPPLSSGALRYAGKVSDVGCRMSDVESCHLMASTIPPHRLLIIKPFNRLLGVNTFDRPALSKEINRDIHGDQNDDDPLQESSVFVMLFFGQHVQHVLQGSQFLAQNFDALLQI